MQQPLVLVKLRSHAFCGSLASSRHNPQRHSQSLIGFIINAGIREEGFVRPGRLESFKQRIEGAQRSLEPGGVSGELAPGDAADAHPWAGPPAPSMPAQPSSTTPAGDFPDNLIFIDTTRICSLLACTLLAIL